jgi:dolichol-phosphate mannosyltransferase
MAIDLKDMYTRSNGAVCILLPVLNEERNIDQLLREIAAAVGSERVITCVVDDGSRDRTVEIVNRHRQADPSRVHLMQRVKTSHGSERGGALYAALAWGLEHTDADVFVEMDGDLSHRPSELPTGIARIREGNDVAIASKYIAGSRITNRPFGRRVVSRICSVLVRGVISRRVHDYSNGYRFYSRAAARAIVETKIRYISPIYLTEVLSIWLSRGMRLVEFPTTYIGRGEGESKLRLTDLAKAAFAIFEIALRLHIVGFAPAPVRAGAASPVRQDAGTRV